MCIPASHIQSILFTLTEYSRLADYKVLIMLYYFSKEICTVLLSIEVSTKQEFLIVSKKFPVELNVIKIECSVLHLFKEPVGVRHVYFSIIYNLIHYQTLILTAHLQYR